ncbi:TPA: fimbrial protein [Cronobacter sakazakii]|uniref:fimbrial protein n=1 Tax=Cronobacter TaxID=413496 RepID=UPI000CFB0C25|nr:MULTISPECIES: fimbrial protein [Cronobacter]EJV9475485.1 fimbrial protein [Cronobacter sakazakii]NCH03631.1 fimbrial protein [Cronobacter malonaticus]NCH44595.1 fimbrial protein [Cronobacter sakazakii]NCH52988.1 fimbrial protein [Cronobacter malonaticus]HDK7323139.1 fimbrial protein [Cronobacter sakazakii]
MKNKLQYVVLFTMLHISTSAWPADNLRFKGNLIIPNCTINNNNAIETDFANIEIQTIANSNTGYHWKQINIPVNCPYTIGTPKITITGNKGSAANSIQTNKYSSEKLVIYLKQSSESGRSGNNITIGQSMRLDSGSVSNNKNNVYLTAGVAREGDMSLLKPGPFTAAATMELRYE